MEPLCHRSGIDGGRGGRVVVLRGNPWALFPSTGALSSSSRGLHFLDYRAVILSSGDRTVLPINGIAGREGQVAAERGKYRVTPHLGRPW